MHTGGGGGGGGSSGAVVPIPAAVAGKLGGAGFVDGPASSARFNSPQGVAVDARRYVYVADTENHAIRRVSPVGDVVTLAGGTLGPADGLPVAGYMDGAAAAALFSHPVGLCVQLQCGFDGSAPGGFANVPYASPACLPSVIVADTMNHRIRRLTCTAANADGCYAPGAAAAAAWLVQTLAGGGNTTRLEMERQASGLADGFAQFARFDSPMGVACDTSGNVFVADTRNHVVRWVDRNANVRTLFGKVVPQPRAYAGCPFPCVRGVPGHLDANATESQFYSPYSIAIGPGRPYTLLVADGDRVRLLSRAGQTPFADSLELGGPGFAQGATANEIEQLNVVVTLAGGSGAAPVVHDVPDGQVSVNSGGPFGRRPGLADGSEDGHGFEAHFDKPRGIAMGVDGRIFVADSSRCRLRSLTTGAQVARHLQCTDRLVDLVRPSGCTGLDAPVDAVDRMATASFAYEVFNYNASGFRAAGGGNGPVRPNTEDYLLPGDWEFQLSSVNDQRVLGDGYLGSGVDGRRPPYCIGTPPPDVGLTMATTAAQRYNGTAEVPYDLDEDSGQGTTFVLRCPPGCAAAVPAARAANSTAAANLAAALLSPNDPYPAELAAWRAGLAAAALNVFGGQLGEYGDSSSVCLAAIHAGLVSDASGGVVIATLRKGFGPGAGAFAPGRGVPLTGSTANSVTSLSVPSATRTFSLESYWLPTHSVDVQTIAGAPEAPLERSTCAFADGEPPLSARFNGPAAVALFFNASLTQAELLYVADAHNHVVRAVTAICSMTCENGGNCTAPEHCTCAPGWGAPDCTQPICARQLCSARQVCTGPDTCSCIPGYTGLPDCTTPLCVQQCEHGGVCVAPDTCFCQPGWFDPNCTTTVCSQTCGNGGNCTSQDHCRCPSMWQGADCRTPVCTQICLNGGFCSAPDTCTCPPSWSSHDCSKPVCHQGFFRADPYPSGSAGLQPYVPGGAAAAAQAAALGEAAGSLVVVGGEALANSTTFEAAGGSVWREPEWLQFEPCDYEAWCVATDEFECYQLQRVVQEVQLPEVRNVSGKGYVQGLDPYEASFSLFTGRPTRGSNLAPLGRCFPIELGTHRKVPYRLDTETGNLTAYARYSAITPYGWGPTSSTNAWSSAVQAPADRQVALVSYKRVAQGVYVCANAGNCTAPDVCVCAPGWVGFDCRTPVCSQGYYYPNRTDARFPGQGTYWGSPRTLTIWENPPTPDGKFPGYLHGTPNFYSQSWDMLPSSGYDVTHVFFLGPGSQQPPIYTVYEGWRLLGWWVLQLTSVDALGNVSQVLWRQGLFNSTFNRTCPGDRTKELDLRWWLVNGSYANATYANGSFVGGTIVNGTIINGSFVPGTAYFARVASRPVDDTEYAFAPRIVYTDEAVISEGRWYEAGGECVDRVVLGCFNNATCALPNTCQCAAGWEGNDCSLPQCWQSVDQNLDTNLTLGELAMYPATLLRASGVNYGTTLSATPPQPGDLNVVWRLCPNVGNCTRPDTCTCEKGWTGADCTIPMCIQECFHGGYCSLPDTCTCPQTPTTFVDARGQPLFVKPDGDAQYTGWTGFDCNTPICVQAAQWVLNSQTGNVQLLADTGSPLINQGEVFQAGCSSDSKYITNLKVTRKAYTLCRIDNWYMGVFRHSWANLEFSGQPQDEYYYVDVPDVSMFSPGRTARVNFPNYIKTVDAAGLVSVTQGPQIAGEGLYACYNTGACVAPDVCECTQGWGGYDCNVPQCAYTDVYLNAISGCSHGGVCYAVNLCECPTVKSLLYLSHPEMPDGANTGWAAKDCTMATCTQGYLDATCKNVPPGPGGVSSMGQGCYKCWNDGTCLTPDHCACPDSWQGYDCKTPVCVQHATRETISQLLDLLDTSETVISVDPALVTAFEYDPCGMSVLVDDGQGNMVSRGNCTRPNTCTCLCRQRAYRSADGGYSGGPWTDPLNRALPRGFIFGRSNCIDGYEGNLNADGTFSTCHLQIFVPSFLQANSVVILAAGASTGIGFIISALLARRQLQIRAAQIKTDRRRTRRMEEAEAKELERASRKVSKNRG